LLVLLKRQLQKKAQLIAFGETLVPGYPIWLERTHSSVFNSKQQKELHALYVNQAVQPEAGDLEEVQQAAKDGKIAVILGIVERAKDRGGKSIYCSRVYIHPDGNFGSIHRKLMPTYEERLSWSIGDGHGLQCHPLSPFTVGSLNCWENWMPLARAALHAQGEDLHVAIWPGNARNTKDISRYMALEGRSYVLSVSGLLREEDLPKTLPYRDEIAPKKGEIIANGGSCLVGPDGIFIIPPFIDKEDILFADLHHQRVFEERQNFDISGHYARPDVLQLVVNRSRQSIFYDKQNTS